MARRAGTTAAGTRELLLDAGARLFAAHGYDHTTTAMIAAAAEVTTGTIYAHFRNKSALFVAVLKERGRPGLDDILAAADPDTVLDRLAEVGKELPDRVDRSALFVEAAIAAKRDPELAQLIADVIADGERSLREAMPDTPAAVARLVTTLVLGSAASNSVPLEPIDAAEWRDLIETLVGRLA